MTSILRRVLEFGQVRRWRRRAIRDRSPRCTVELCRVLVRLGRLTAALEAARHGLDRFPRSVELQEILHATWKRTGRRRLEDLEARLASDRSVAHHEALIDYYLEFNELDRASRASETLLSEHPSDPRSAIVHGRVHLARFHRDHVARDGAIGLKSLQRAVELDPAGPDANFTLAETYYYIGAVSKALFHVYRALDANPPHPGAKRLYEILSRLPLEKDEEGELLREVEERDEAWFRTNAPAPGGAPPELERTLLDRLEQVSLMAGVRRAAVVHEGRSHTTEGAPRRHAAPARDEAFAELAKGFRRAASLSAKRMGIGAFEEAELSWSEGAILAAAAGATIIVVETEATPRIPAIAAEVRDIIAGCAVTGPGEADD